MKSKSLGILALAILISSAGIAQGNKNTSAYPNDEIPFYEKDGVKLSVKNNTPLVFAGINDIVTGNTPSEMAFDWISKNKEALKVDTISDLIVYSERSGLAGHNIRLRQYKNGIPVYKSEIVVHISPKNTVTYVTNNFDSSVENISTSPAITSEHALELAKENIAATGEINYVSSDLNVYNRQNSTALIYTIVLEVEFPLGSWEILVNAQNGTIIRAANLACSHTDEQHSSCSLPPPVNGTGTVFLPDPLSVAGAPYAAPYLDNNDATNASFDATMSTVTLLDIDFSGGLYRLVGPYAEVQNFENPNNGLFAQASSSFNFDRNDDAFEAVNCYYHIDNSMRYINVTLGISLMPFQYSSGVRYDPHGLNGADNSHYLGGSGRMSFGEGGVDDAEDADVILHELGHGLHDWVTGGNLSQVNGLSEGSGDYWATSYSRSLNQWLPADPEYQWMFSWDGHNPFWNGRITNYGALYPGGLTGAIHTDGQIWATALMRIYDIIGRDKVDAAFLEGLAMTGSSTNQQDAAIAVRQAAIDLGYPCADISVFTTEFTATGYILPALPGPTGSETSTICNNESVLVNGTIYDAGNPTGTEIILGGPGCDSTVTINLTVLPALVGSVTNTICTEESIVVNGTTYDAGNSTGTEIFTSAGPSGCDSIVTINLNVLPAITGSVANTICEGGSIVVNGTTYDSGNPTGTEIFTSAGPFGCDSTVTINLNVLAALTGSVANTICDGESIVVNGTTYDSGNLMGTEIFTGIGSFGCDSTVTINLTALPALIGSITTSICDGESIVVNGTTYDSGNLAGTEIFTGVGPFGCDSTVTVNLTALPALTGSLTSTICEGESIVVNGTTYDAGNPSGTEIFTNVGAFGCDSTVTINLTINSVNSAVTQVGEIMTADQVGAVYQWLTCPAMTPISGATNQSYTAILNGDYAVIVTNNGCTDTSACFTVDGLGIAENGFEEGLILYPNPTADGIFNIKFDGIIQSIQVIDLIGHLITLPMDLENGQVDGSMLNAGEYILRIQANDLIITKRITVL